jgi:hypothetical protein
MKNGETSLAESELPHEVAGQLAAAARTAGVGGLGQAAARSGDDEGGWPVTAVDFGRYSRSR